MNTLHAGLMCTVLLTGTIASLFGCMSAVRRHRRFAFAACLAIASLDFAVLAVLLSRLPGSETLAPVPWTAAALSLTALSLFASFTLWHKSRRQLSPVSIKESCDHLPGALCFAWENGQTWSFARVRLGMSGKTVYQITGTNITEEARLQRELEKDNLRLKDINRRLRQYGQDVQEATREKEILRAKTRVHDQIGHALLQTRQFLSGTQGDAARVCAAWRQNTQLLLTKYADEQRMDAFE